MKTNRTIKRLLFAATFLVAGLVGANAQTSPASVTDGTSTLRQFGVNNAGVAKATEYVDSITAGAQKVKYVVWPDSVISSTYVFPKTNLNSHFVWSFSPAVSLIDTTVTGYASNYALVNFPTPGTLPADYAISVYEKANAGGCTASARQYTVRLISAPNVTNCTFSALNCPTGIPPYSVTGPTATLTIDSKVSGKKDVVVTYDLTGPTGFTTQTGVTATLGNGNQIDLSTVTLSQPGTYTVTIKTVVDRISTKSGVVTTLTSGNTYTFTLNRAPVTGPIYHLPNM